MQDEWKLPASAGVRIALSGVRVGSIIGERFDPGFGRSSERCVLRLRASYVGAADLAGAANEKTPLSGRQRGFAVWWVLSDSNTRPTD